MKTRIALILVSTAVCFVAIVAFFGSVDVRLDDFEHESPSPDKVISLGFEDQLEYIRNEASKIVEKAFGEIKDKSRQFRQGG